jgi:hypothetical protein
VRAMGTLTKQEIRKRLGVETDTEVAAFFDITLSAVSQWREDAPIPELRQLQAERKRPDLFGPSAAEEPAPRHRPPATPAGNEAAEATPPSTPLSEAA